MAEVVGWIVIAAVAIIVAALFVILAVSAIERLIRRFEEDGARKARERDGFDIALAWSWFDQTETQHVLKLIGHDLQNGYRIDANRIRERMRCALRDEVQP
jgi:hypothetical protein